jgi:hypothetical protein
MVESEARTYGGLDVYVAGETRLYSGGFERE